MKSKRLAALLVLEEDVVLMSFFQKLIYFRSQCCHWLQLHNCADRFLSEVCAVNPSSIFFSSTFFFFRDCFVFRSTPTCFRPAKKNPFQRSYRQGHFRCSYPQGHRLSKRATVDRRRACPSGCPRTLKDGVTASRRKAALGKFNENDNFEKSNTHACLQNCAWRRF